MRITESRLRGIIRSVIIESLDDFPDFETFEKQIKNTPDMSNDRVEWGEIGYMPIGKFGPREAKAATVDLRRSTKKIHFSRNPVAKLLSDNDIIYDSDSFLKAINKRYELYYKSLFNDSNPRILKKQVHSILEILKSYNIRNSKDFMSLSDEEMYDIVWEIIDEIRL